MTDLVVLRRALEYAEHAIAETEKTIANSPNAVPEARAWLDERLAANQRSRASLKARVILYPYLEDDYGPLRLVPGRLA